MLVSLPASRPESYAVAVPLTSIHSLLVQPSSLSSWCKHPPHIFLPALHVIARRFRSVGVNLTSGSTPPTFHFHDGGSHPFSLPSKSSSPSNESTPYPPPPSLAGQASTGRPVVSWGGEGFLSRLRPCASPLRPNLQPTLYLLDPSKADVEVHPAQLFSDDVGEVLARLPFANSCFPVTVHGRQGPVSASNTPPSPYSRHSPALYRSMQIPPSRDSSSQAPRLAPRSCSPSRTPREPPDTPCRAFSRTLLQSPSCCISQTRQVPCECQWRPRVGQLGGEGWRWGV